MSTGDAPTQRQVAAPDDDRYRDVVHILEQLRRAGHEAWLVGGCVRDLVLGRLAKDYDVATSARPDDVGRLFRRTAPIGKAFGVVHVRRSGRNWISR